MGVGGVLKRTDQGKVEKASKAHFVYFSFFSLDLYKILGKARNMS